MEKLQLIMSSFFWPFQTVRSINQQYNLVIITILTRTTRNTTNKTSSDHSGEWGWQEDQNFILKGEMNNEAFSEQSWHGQCMGTG
jgi:hypothetical protein